MWLPVVWFGRHVPRGPAGLHRTGHALVGRAGEPIAWRPAVLVRAGAPISPHALFFRAGAPIGGPAGTVFRGDRALSFPAPAYYAGPGSPLAPELTGFAGAPLGPVRRGGEPIGGGGHGWLLLLAADFFGFRCGAGRKISPGGK